MTFTKVVHAVPPSDKDDMLSNIICMPSASPDPTVGYLPMVINWKPTSGLIPCHVQPRPAHEPWTPLSRKIHRKNIRPSTLRSLFHRSPCKWSMPPPLLVCLQDYLPMGIKCKGAEWLLWLLILCSCCRQLRFSLYSGAVTTRTWF